MVHFSAWKAALVALVLALGLAYAAPNMLDAETLPSGAPTWLPVKQVNLGLDLQGGSHLLLSVGVDEVLDDRLEALTDGVRTALRQARIRYKGLGLQGGVVRVSVREAEKLEAALAAIRETEPEIELSGDEDSGRIEARFTEDAADEIKNSAVLQSIEIVRRRVDETGVNEPSIQRQGADRILVQLPGLDDPERVKRLLGRTAKLEFKLLNTSMSAAQAQATRPPAGAELLPVQNPGSGESAMYLVQKRVMVGGEHLVDAQTGFDSQTNQPVVNFRFDTVGAKKFGKVTTDNVGRPFAIVLDDEVVSAPVIREPILGGSGQISGNFNVRDAQDLSLVLRAGALPAPLTILEERTVGPGLGRDSIEAGKLAAVVGLIAVAAFMIISYGLFGVMANIALAFNVVLILAVLSGLQATLTLPGVAGIILTIGMAVDANVLIFERIREEARAGRTPIAAIDAGYSRALTTIWDANVTTFIAAALLFAFGSGPVRGFAVTLAVGIVTSMFTAIMITRLMVVVWLRRKRPSALPV
ncbi:MAG: protein translocase subunit SecD [Rhodospirillales bacterium]